MTDQSSQSPSGKATTSPDLLYIFTTSYYYTTTVRQDAPWLQQSDLTRSAAVVSHIKHIMFCRSKPTPWRHPPPCLPSYPSSPLSARAAFAARLSSRASELGAVFHAMGKTSARVSRGEGGREGRASCGLVTIISLRAGKLVPFVVSVNHRDLNTHLHHANHSHRMHKLPSGSTKAECKMQSVSHPHFSIWHTPCALMPDQQITSTSAH